uniref:Alpha/beta hydrolases superfamily protein n=1 Tax=Tanacetum cinerariifolium TaxID=118510 RepID=A0A6L2N8L8_TANCI|nr:alpha/beta hydrolases superfamily protein [Tanacetum cinerariifolium]
MKKDFKIYKGKKERVKSVVLKEKKESSDDETSTSRSEDEEYAMAVKDFKKLYRRKDSESSNMNTSADVNITKVKRLHTNPSVATPSKPTEERRKREEVEDSDDEVTGDMDDGGADGKESSLTDKKKKKRCTHNTHLPPSIFNS